jgi:hypothetical protein
MKARSTRFDLRERSMFGETLLLEFAVSCPRVTSLPRGVSPQ